jgi:transcriptional regulator with XRE-family HTH domain
MLTTVRRNAQLRLVGESLTLVDMSTLQSRLERAMEHAKKKQSDLAKACDISTAAVAKWFGGSAKNLKMEHLFAVSDLCRIDPRWLATGKGSMERTGKTEPSDRDDIPQRRIDLIRMYGRLPDEVRQPIRSLIETLAWMHHPHKAEYEAFFALAFMGAMVGFIGWAAWQKLRRLRKRH